MGGTDEFKPWIGDQRCPGIGHQCHIGTILKDLDDLLGTRGFVVIVQGQEPFRMCVQVRQQMSAPSGILGGHNRHRLQDIYRS